MINSEERKLKLLAANPLDIYVITHRTAEGKTEYTYMLNFPCCQTLNMCETWLEATWYESRQEAESLIADSVRDVYSVEHIGITRDNLERTGSVVVTKPANRGKFKCACGCEFEAPAKSCETTTSFLNGDQHCYNTVTFWKKCPECGTKCSDLRIKECGK